MKNKGLETDIRDVFDDAEGIHTLIWYTSFETLQDAILRVIGEHEND